MDLFGKRRIAQLEDALETQKRLFDIQQQGWREMESRYRILHSHLAVTNRGIGRLIAKLDPLYAADELNRDRKAESDKIGNAVLSRLMSEHKLSNPHE